MMKPIHVLFSVHWFRLARLGILYGLLTLWTWDTQAQLVTTVAGTVETPGDTDGHALNEALFSNPHGIAADKYGRVYIADRWNHKIRVMDTRVDSVYTLAGTGAIGTDDGPGNQARFYSPWGLTCDSLGTVYVADTKNQLIRKIDTLGNVTTYAGSGTFGVMDGPATASRFADPTGITISPEGDLFVCDHVAHTIRKITPGGVVTTIAGKAFVEGDVDGTGNTARFYRPYGIELNADGDILVADEWNHKIRKVTQNGFTTTVAGSGLLGSDDGVASLSRFNYPWDVAEDKDGAIYVMDGYNHTIRRIENGMVETWAGISGETGGQDGFGINASFSGATAICYGTKGDYIYVGDAFNDLIRRVEKSTGVSLSTENYQNGDTACLGENIVITASPDFYQSYEFFLDGTSVQNGTQRTYSTTLGTIGSFQMTVEAVHQDGYTVSSVPFTLDVVAPPAADFSYSLDSEGPGGYTVAFQSLSTGAIAWQWDFGDTLSGAANTSTLENPTHLYQNEGAYDVELITIGAGGCRDTLLRERFVAFLALETSPTLLDTGDSLCVGETIEFTANTLIYNSYLFYENGQLVQSGSNISYQNTFDSPGEQRLYVVGIDADGDSTISRELAFYVAPYPEAAFEVNVQGQNQDGFTVDFEYTGTGANQWLWDFGDEGSGADNQSSLQNPSHVYAQAGDYDVSLITIGVGGCADTLLRTGAVALLGMRSEPVSLLANDTLCVGESTLFVAEPDIFDTYAFSVNGVILQNSPSTDFAYTFAEIGTDEIQVVGQSGGGKTASSAILPIHVVAYPEVDVSFQILGQQSGGYEVEFTTTGTGARQYFWEFGDPSSGPENVSTLSQPTHVYQQEGVYDVQLITTGAGGCQDTVFKQDFVILLDLFSSTLSRNDTVCVGHITTFTANTDIFEQYDFYVNGIQVQVSEQDSYETIFNTSGEYEVWVVGSSSDGKSVQSPPFAFTVADIPVIDFVIVDESLDRTGYTVQFQSNVSNAVSLIWTFGDSTSLENTSTGLNPTHTYAEFGSYTVSLTAGSGGQCNDSLAKVDFVVFEDKPANLFVPNAFTPNGDGVNDMLYLRGQNITEMSFMVFNEWGEVIFQSQSPDQGWDGLHNGSPVPPDTYIYAARVTLANGQTEVIKGQTTVIR